MSELLTVDLRLVGGVAHAAGERAQLHLHVQLALHRVVVVAEGALEHRGHRGPAPHTHTHAHAHTHTHTHTQK